jgi:hypothetical protein
MKENEMEHVAWLREMRIAYRVLVGGKRPLQRPRYR